MELILLNIKKREEQLAEFLKHFVIAKFILPKTMLGSTGDIPDKLIILVKARSVSVLKMLKVRG